MDACYRSTSRTDRHHWKLNPVWIVRAIEATRRREPRFKSTFEGVLALRPANRVVEIQQRTRLTASGCATDIGDDVPWEKNMTREERCPVTRRQRRARLVSDGVGPPDG